MVLMDVNVQKPQETIRYGLAYIVELVCMSKRHAQLLFMRIPSFHKPITNRTHIVPLCNAR